MDGLKRGLAVRGRDVILCAMWVMMVCRGGAMPSANNRIDELVFSRQLETGFSPNELCSDEVFVRRVWVDLAGIVPPADEVLLFLHDPRPDKRSILIDRLLEKTEFADVRALKWGDLLRIQSEFPSNLWPNAVQAYHRWIRDAIRDNMPYDQFARALLTASGSNFRDPPSNFYRPFQERVPRSMLETVALLFMGVRLDQSGWTEEQLLGLDAFFATVSYKGTAEWKEEVVWSDPARQLLHPRTGKVVPPRTPCGFEPDIPERGDPRIAFADWLTSPDNPWFARNIVNRVWFWLMGRGIIHEPDDIRPDNPPWCPALLAYLERELIDSGYDLRHLFRLIANSATYQLCSIPTPANLGDETGFSRYRIRRMDAEVLIDSINRITGMGDEYSSAIPEPFTFVPATRRTVTLADGSIKSPFLETFGRPSRDTSFESDRANDLSVFQSLHLLNSSHIHDKIMGGAALSRLRGGLPDNVTPVRWIYLDILSRDPKPEEVRAIHAYAASSGLPMPQVMADTVWALMNTTEFMMRH